VFLEAEGALAASHAWAQLQPLGGSLLEGVARLPKQLLGARPRPAHLRCHRLVSQWHCSRWSLKDPAALSGHSAAQALPLSPARQAPACLAGAQGPTTARPRPPGGAPRRAAAQPTRGLQCAAERSSRSGW